ncbi:MAG: winged helix-turn-helix domain-containing protein [Candidatus Eremiobacteraeota bacterium]|nr:winged helix-turn-helix domain-containing protein [Candidatus Eremiobacteraeota bacterium]
MTSGGVDYTKRAPGKYELGDYTVDLKLRALVFRGRHVELAPRSFDLLLYLLQHNDRVVSKRELLETLWPPGSVQQSLRQEVYTLRRALRMNTIPSCISTVSQFGYRFDHRGVTEEDSILSTGPALSSANQRALAVASHFAVKGDSVSLARSLKWYQKVCAALPDLAEAHAGAVRALITLGRRSQMPIAQVLVQAKTHLHRMLVNPLDRASPFLSAAVTAILEKNADCGIPSLLSMRHSSERSAHISHALAIAYMVAGDLERAVIEQSAAVNEEPTSLHLHADYGMLRMFLGDYDTAQAQFAFLQKLEPRNPDTNELLAQALTLQASYVDAIAVLQSVDRQPAVNATLCVALARSGKRCDALTAVNALLEQRAQTFVSPYYLAKCYTALGDQEKAIVQLRRATREPIFGTLKFNPWFESLREEHSFRELGL